MINHTDITLLQKTEMTLLLRFVAQAVREWMITSLNMKNSHTSLWIADYMQPMLQCTDGSSPTDTARCGNAGIVNMLDLAHYPIQGVLVIGHYE